MNIFGLSLKGVRFGLGMLVLILAALPVASDAAEWVRARWVADGDTIILQDRRHVRYIGIDTPEIDHKNNHAAPFGIEALSRNRQLVEGWRLRLVFDREKKDRYGRTLAYVYRSDGLFVNAELLKEGLAYVLYRFPNGRRKAKTLLSAQREAMEKHVGIWQLVNKNETPVHAYLGNRRSKRFHIHGCSMGKKMADKNRVWLKNQWTAFFAGYAPAKDCIPFPGDK
jgi:micrococcal nuclease